MKDEELAEEYAEDFVKDKYGGSRHCAEVQKEKLFLKIGFQDGFKAGRPQWHILAEEPDVLPEEGQKVKVLTEEGDIENSTYFYDTYYEEFAFSNIGLLKVFAWCEIPTFDKE